MRFLYNAIQLPEELILNFGQLHCADHDSQEALSAPRTSYLYDSSLIE
jgi:hypothetical protein